MRAQAYSTQIPSPMEQSVRGPIDNARFAHAVVFASRPVPVINPQGALALHSMPRRPCGSSRQGRLPSSFYEKALKISNVFRQALGLPSIKTESLILLNHGHGHNTVHVEHGFVTILPDKSVGPDRTHPFIDFENGSPIDHFMLLMGGGPFDGNIEILPASAPYPNHCHHHHHPHHQVYHRERNSFAT